MSRLVDLIDEDIYANCGSVFLTREANAAARAAAQTLNDDGTPDAALRAAIDISTDVADIITGLVEILLSYNAAWESTTGP